ncbi:esterase/lipase family protein [Roseiarcus sp.]|uniref:esterase/lipase family protein n=1 Tax=Roseiarcus sp. TaxID=1969460 RepID=UPI003F96F985
MSRQRLCAPFCAKGYQPHGWNHGRNLELRPGLKEGLLARLRALRSQSGRKVSLIGWSLGGVHARELAKLAVDDVRLVITLGSPFKSNTKATRATKLYLTLSDRTVENARVTANLHHPPSVPTTAIFSRSDGVVAWQCCVEDAGSHTESIEVRSSHSAWAIIPRSCTPLPTALLSRSMNGSRSIAALCARCSSRAPTARGRAELDVVVCDKSQVHGSAGFRTRRRG